MKIGREVKSYVVARAEEISDLFSEGAPIAIILGNNGRTVGCSTYSRSGDTCNISFPLVGLNSLSKLTSQRIL